MRPASILAICLILATALPALGQTPKTDAAKAAAAKRAATKAAKAAAAKAKKTAAGQAGSGEWPQWRGPNRDGVSAEKGLLRDWRTRPPELAWRATGLGAGFSSVSVADGRIYTMGDRQNEQHVIALDLQGKELWSARVGQGWDESYGGPRCTPTVDGDLVFAVGAHGDLVCVAAADGTEKWRKNFAADFGGTITPQWGFAESPLVDGDKLVCTPGGADAAMVALNKQTGEEIWRAAVPSLGPKGKDGAGYSSIVVSEAAQVRQYVQLTGRGLFGVDAEHGKFLWGYNKVANGVACIPTPIVRGDFVFGSSSYGEGGAALLKLSARGGVLVDEVYYLTPDDFQNHHGGMILVGDYLYAGDGHNNGFPTCLEFATGKRMWGKQRGPGTGSAAIGYADGHLYFRYQNGLMALIAASPKKYQLKGTFKIPEGTDPSWPQPVIAGGKLYLRDQDSLLCYSLTQK